MFVGHYGVSFAVRKREPHVPLWLLFITGLARRTPMIVFGVVMFVIQAFVFFGPPPVSDTAAAVTALVAYAIFALVVRVLEQRQAIVRARSSMR